MKNINKSFICKINLSEHKPGKLLAWYFPVMVGVHFLEDEFGLSVRVVPESDHKCLDFVQMQWFMTVYIDQLEQLSNVLQRIKILFISHRTDKLSIINSSWSIEVDFLENSMHLLLICLSKKLMKLLVADEAIIICIDTIKYSGKLML